MTRTIMSSFPYCPPSAIVQGSLVSEWLSEFHTYPLNHIFWLGAYSTHLVEASHFQHYILILVGGAHQEKFNGCFRPWIPVELGTAVGCKLLILRATSSSSKNFVVYFFKIYFAMLYKILFSNLGFMSLQPFVPSALTSSVISCSNIVSVFVPVVHERLKNAEFDWQNY